VWREKWGCAEPVFAGLISTPVAVAVVPVMLPKTATRDAVVTFANVGV